MGVLSHIVKSSGSDTNQLIVPPEQARVLYYVSHVGVLTSALAYYKGHVYLASVVGTCVGTSLSYWNRPTYGMRRNIDIAAVQLSLWSHTYNAHSSQYVLAYYIIIGLGIAAFFASWNTMKQNKLWHSTLLHAVVHISAHMSSLCVYYG
jgi:hypothetical protein